MTILRGQDVFRHLAKTGDEAETTRSSFWNHEVGAFQVDADGRIDGETVLGTVSAKIDPIRTLAHRVLQSPFRWFPKPLPELSQIECLARTVARRQGRQYTHDMMRQALTLAYTRRAVPRGQLTSSNLVIGDGFGVLSSLLLLDDPTVRTICVNLTKSLLIDLTRIRMSVPDVEPVLVSNTNELSEALADQSVRLIAVCADDAAALKTAPIHAAFNVVSMQEMSPDVVAAYFDILRSNPAEKTTFYCCNKLWKPLPDGSELKFHDYPWHDSDTIFGEGPCPWSQWFYNTKPPFWHRRKIGKYTIWHRLAILNKQTNETAT